MKPAPNGYFSPAAIAAALLTGAVLSAGPQLRAQTPIKIVVPYAPGGVNDVLARLLAAQIGASGGPTMVIENRPGAGGAIGTETVARAAPDGNTLLIASTPFIIDPQLHDLKYDPLTSFEPICYLVNSPTAIVVSSESPYRTLADLLEAARAKPGQLTLASIGPGSSFQLGFETLKRAAKVDITFVPYPGNAPALNAVLGQQVTAMFGTFSNVAEYVKGGKLRALAVDAHARLPSWPDVPTIGESGFKDFAADAWFGALAPVKTPKEKIAELGNLFTTAMQAAELKAKLDALGLAPVGMCGADFAAYLRKQFDEDARIINEANIKAE